MKTIIIDDEKLALLALDNDIQTYCPELNIIAKLSSPTEAITAINNLKPALVITDIQMPIMNAFTMLEQLTWKNFELIFVTAYNKYALKAFEFSAIDYLVKPIDSHKLIKSVQKVLTKKNKKTLEEKIKIVVQNMKFGDDNFTLALPTRNGIEFVDVNDIIRIKAESNYSMVYFTKGKPKLISKPLKHFCDMLSEASFIRIHQSHLINTVFIRKYLKTNGGTIVLKDDTSLPVSRSQKAILNSFLFGTDI